MTFQPGQSGNPGGRSKNKEWAAALRIAVNEAHEEGKTKLRALADKIVSEGLAGNVQALKEIGDRIDGKVPQALIGGDDDDNPITLKTIITGVPRAGDSP
jgi:hypothetical protein